MKSIVMFAVGYAAACGLFAVGIGEQWIWLVMGLSAAAIPLAMYFRKRLEWLRIPCLIGTGLLMGCGWALVFQGVYLNRAIAVDGVTCQATVTVADFPEETSYGGLVDGWIKLEGKPYQVRIYLDSVPDLTPGDQISGEFRFRITTSGETSTQNPGKGRFLLAFQQGSVTCQASEKCPWWCYGAILRRHIQSVLDDAFDEGTAPLAKALLLGDTSDLSYEVDTSLKISGIRHVIAVSGLHVSILYGIISFVTMKKRYLTLLIGAPVLLLFAAVAGFTPSVVRACLMVMLMMLAMELNREYDPPSALAFAVIVMLTVNPLTVTSVGFQLSVASVAGIFLFSKPISGWLARYIPSGTGKLAKLGNGICSSVGVSVGATLLTAPLCAWYFGMVSLVAVVTNLLVIWMISFIFYGIIGVYLLSLLWQGGAVLLAKPVSVLIRIVLAISGAMARVPMAAVYTASSYIIIWLVFVYIQLGVFLLSRKKRPGLLLCCAFLGLFLAQTASFLEPLTDECRVTVLDVGQGQSILLQCGGRSYLVDCGGDSDTFSADLAAETLLSQGITRLDGIILTHYDRDHAGGVPYLLTRIQTDLLLIPGYDEDGTGQALAELTDGATVFVTRDVLVSDERMQLTVFGPIYPDSDNENSLCILFQTENCAILITGDRSGVGERSLLRHTDLPEVDVLIAGHHGSRYSTCEELLEAVQPEIVVISVGENRYGHPAEDTLERIQNYTYEIFRTDLNGTVIFRR